MNLQLNQNNNNNNKNNNKQTKTKWNHANVQNREPLGFVPRIIGFIQTACYASIVDKTLVNISEKTEHIF